MFEAALNCRKKTMKGTVKTFMRPQVLVKLCTKCIYVFLHENMATQYKNPPDKSKAGRQNGENGAHKRANLLNQSSNYDPMPMEARHTTDRQTHRPL